MKGFTEISPKQKFMTIVEIQEAFGSRAVVAYSCKVVDSVPQGGFVVAVQDKVNENTNILKEYQRQFTKKYPNKRPVYYLRVEKTEGDKYFSYIYDNGSGEVRTIQKIEVKKSEAQTAIENIPNEFLAKALLTSLRADEH